MSTPPASGNRVALLLGVLVALTVIGSSAVAVALPSVGEELGVGLAGRAWVLAVFGLTFSISTAVFGRVADLAGLRLPLRIGVGLLAAGSLVSAFAPVYPVLLAGRVLQGIGAGAVPVLAVGVIAAVFDEEHRPGALGALTGVVALVSGSGPLIGGALAQLVSWRAVVGLPVVALLLMGPVARLAPSGRTGSEQGLDARGAVLVAAVVVGVVLVLQSPSTGAGGPVLAAALALAAGAALLLARHVRRMPEGFLPLAIVRDRVLLLSAGAALPLLAAYFGLLLAIPQVLTDEQGWGPFRIGLALLPAAAAGSLASRVAPVLARRLGRETVAAALCVGSAAGVALAAAAAPRPVLLVAGLACASCGFSGGQVVLLDGVTAAADPRIRGVAIGIFNLLFFTGGAVGTAVVGGLAGLLTLPGALGVLVVLPALGAGSALLAGRAVRATTPQR